MPLSEPTRLWSNMLGVDTEYQGKTSTAGAADAYNYVVANAAGVIDSTFLTNADVEIVTVLGVGTLAANDLVNIYDGDPGDTHASWARKSDAGTNKYAVSGVVLVGGTDTNITVLRQCIITTTGLTVGSTYWASDTPGTWTATPVTGAGKYLQKVGVALSITQMAFLPESPRVLLA